MTMTWLDDGCPLRDDPSPVQEVRLRRAPDPALTVVVAILALGGLAVSGSARVYEDALEAGSPEGLMKSAVHLGFGVVTMLTLMLPHYALLTRRAALWAALSGSVLLLLLPFAGPEIHGTHRWFRIYGVSMQPSELIKPVLVLVVAASLVHAGEELRRWSGLARPLLLAGLLTGLVLAGKDLGTPVLLVTTTLAMAFVAGARLRHLCALALAGIPLFLLFARMEAYRWERLTNFTQALGVSGTSFDAVTGQLRQSLIAIGSGGITGKGFGSSSQKAFFLPERDTDFVFAIISEELGLIGAFAVLALFLVVGWRGVCIARDARDRLGMLVASGTTCLLCTQALCHAGVVTGLLPTKGLPLPFLSTGGSSLIASFALVGLLLNVSLRRRARGT